MVMIAQQQQKPLNLSNAFSGITNDPVMQQGLLGNWAFNMANQKGNGGRSFFENFANFPHQNSQTGRQSGIFKNWSDKLLSAYDSHVNTPNLQADILFQDTYMGGNNNKKQDIGWGLLG